MKGLKRLRGHLSAWHRLSAGNRALVCEAVPLLIAARIALTALPFRVVVRLFRLDVTRPDSSGGLTDTQRTTIAQTVSAAAAYVPKASCLTRSITLFVMLKRRGDAVRLYLGVTRPERGRLDAHAWVERANGVPIVRNESLGSASILSLTSMRPPLQRPLWHELHPEQQALLQIVRRCESSNPDDTEPLPDSLDWSKLFRLAGPHGLASHLLACLHDGEGPMDERKQFAAAGRMQTIRNLAHAAWLIDLLTVFRRRDIPVLALKGHHLALTLYRNPGLRTFEDIDLFVDPANVGRAHETLVDAGYRLVSPDIALDAIPSHSFFRVTQDNDYGYANPTNGSQVELHWSLIRRSLGTVVTFTEAWQDRRDVCLGEHAIPGLGNVHQLLYLAVHGTKHRWRRLEWLSSFGVLAGMLSPEEWTQLWTLAEQRRQTPIVLFALHLCAELCTVDVTCCGVRVPDFSAEQPHLVREVIDMLRHEGPPPDDLNDASFYIAVRASASERAMAWGRHAVLPSHRDLAALPLWLRRAPFYWLIRPARLTASGALRRRRWLHRDEAQAPSRLH